MAVNRRPPADTGSPIMTKRLDHFTTLTFDCYGTLIDWETGIWDALQPLLAANGADVERAAALATFARRESAIQAAHPGMLYPDTLTHAHRALADELGFATSDELDEVFGRSLPHWPAFADSAGALRKLKTRYKLVILSNVNRAGFAASNLKLGVAFDAVYTAEDIGSYKPDPRNFAYLLERLKADLGVGKADILHTAQSLFHDHVPARAVGLANAWIDRQGLSTGDNWGATARLAERPDCDFVYPDMISLARAAGVA
jgi:2-haloalkanoic acid dehalogenase type II